MIEFLINNQYLIQAIGFIGLVFSLLIFQVNKRKKMLNLYICSTCFYMVHYLLLGAHTAVAMNIIGIARNYAFTKSKRVIALPIFFILLFVVGGFVTWNGPLSLLPVLGMTGGTLAYWQKDEKMIRRFALISPPLWFIYNVMLGSYPGMIAEVVMLVSNMVGIYRFDILKQTSNLDNII